ncbi:Gamma-tubulin complex component 6 [Acipenser ruthenus]|uniref:Gamma-tubulin complex component n=1 Tax=Acipenser ruthenus TaxID=7906 RepID=A0A444V1I2_ACIRT|nr:Gamma-tubulin complex component 6 [Acipenser ruthenus]
MEASVESLLCQGPPWGEGEGWGPEWPREQAYLHSLAAQYQVEQYQDSYNLMTAAPDSHLLHQVTAGPYAFPVDPSLRRATDTTAVQLSEMVVFLVNKAIVDYYFMELNVERHCEALRHFLLMEDGEFAQSLSDLLFEKVDWPLNIVITDSCMNKYNRIFSFLLQLKHMVWTLRDIWFHLKRAALVKGAGSSVQFRQLQLYRHGCAGLSRCPCALVTKLVNRGYQPHLEDFLLRINFNSYYQDS